MISFFLQLLEGGGGGGGVIGMKEADSLSECNPWAIYIIQLFGKWMGTLIYNLKSLGDDFFKYHKKKHIIFWEDL